MPDSGGTYSRVHNWLTDKNATVPITASRFDAENDDFAAALNNRLLKDGSTLPTANLAMNGKKHTNVANATARNQYLSLGQFQDLDSVYAVDTGAANAYVITLSVSPGALTAGQRFVFKAINANTGTSTIDVNSLGATTIKVNGTLTLETGDIVVGGIYTIIYDGTDFQLQNSSAARYV